MDIGGQLADHHSTHGEHGGSWFFSSPVPMDCSLTGFSVHGIFQAKVLEWGAIAWESRHRRNVPQHNKNYIWQTHSKHYSQWWKTENISSKIRNKKRVPILTTIQYSFKIPSHGNERRKRSKKNLGWKRNETFTVCRWHDTIHRKHLRCHQKITRANQWI